MVFVEFFNSIISRTSQTQKFKTVLIALAAISVETTILGYSVFFLTTSALFLHSELFVLISHPLFFVRLITRKLRLEIITLDYVIFTHRINNQSNDYGQNRTT